MGDASSLIAYRQWNQLIFYAIWFSRLAIICKNKAFRSLEAYNQIWFITTKDGTINYSHCLGCKAGLAESCSLIANVLFYFEAWTKVNGRLSCKQIRCPMILPSSANKVEYSRVRHINFKSAKKMKADVDETIENLSEGLQVSDNSKVFTESPVKKPEVPAPTQAEMENFYFDLRNEKQGPVLLSLVPTADSTSKEMSITFFSWFIKYLFFELDFFPWLPFTFSCNTFQLTTSGSLVSLGGNFKIGLKLFDRTTFLIT